MVLISLLLVLLVATPSFATDRTAATCEAADIQTQIDASSDCDTVIVPAGSCTWDANETISIAKSITVKGAGALASKGANGQVTITMNTAASQSRGIGMNSSTHASCRVRLQNLTLISGGSAEQGIPQIALFGTDHPGIVEFITSTLTPTGMYDFIHIGHSKGVISNNIVSIAPPGAGDGYLNQSGMRCKVGNATNTHYANNPTYGADDTTGENNVYIESNEFNYLVQVIDWDDACKGVFRYNTVTNGTVLSHGFDTSDVGARHIEVYNNTFQCSATGNLSTWISARGGTWLVTDNVIPYQNTQCATFGGHVGAMTYSIWRLASGGHGCYAGSYPFNHQFGWGWNSGTCGSDVDCQALEPSYYWNNTRTGGGTADVQLSNQPSEGWSCVWGCSRDNFIVSATRSGTTATVTLTKTETGMVTGDRVLISGVSPSQYNGTYTVTVTGSNPTVFTYTMASDPGSSGDVSGQLWYFLCSDGGTPQNISTFVQLDRDFYSCVNGSSSCAKPSYTKYTYPHPLTTMTTMSLVPPHLSGLLLGR